LLSSQDRSAKRLVELLVARGIEEAVAEEAVAGLRSDGWVDDARYAELRARSLVERRSASHALVAESLAQDGLEADLAATTARRVAPRRDDLTRAVELARRSLGASPSKPSKRGNQSATVRRVAAALARGGFEADTIATALERVGLRLEPEGDS
jgi:regulatory protein